MRRDPLHRIDYATAMIWALMTAFLCVSGALVILGAYGAIAYAFGAFTFCQ